MTRTRRSPHCMMRSPRRAAVVAATAARSHSAARGYCASPTAARARRARRTSQSAAPSAAARRSWWACYARATRCVRRSPCTLVGCSSSRAGRSPRPSSSRSRGRATRRSSAASCCSRTAPTCAHPGAALRAAGSRLPPPRCASSPTRAPTRCRCACGRGRSRRCGSG
ncbi:hypothetical protein T492DRAFT_1022722 [Pavlovales sp. CCMP2436]|nr:hypothetical protein T492DRAFT_1022722 [Pavlovales sp. CCMP2436]